MKHIVNRLIACLTGLIIPCVAVAVAAAGDITVYTLEDLCRAANDNAQQIRIANDDLFIARQEKQRALSVLVPRATAFGNFSRYHGGDMMSPDTTVYGMKLTQSFTLNGRELIAYDVSKKGIEKSRFTLEQIRCDYLLQVARTFFDTLRAKRLLEIAETEVDRLDAHRESVKEKLKVGSVTRTDLFRAEAELSRAKSDQVASHNAVIQSNATIARLSGIEAPFQLLDVDMAELDRFHPVLSEIQAKALENRYEIKAAKKNQAISQQTIAYEKGDYWPKLNLETGYRKSDLSYGDSLFGSFMDDDTEESYFTAELVFTLYDGGLRAAQIKQAVARDRQAGEALDLVTEDILLDSRIAFSEYETARNTLINLADELTSARENYSAVQMQYQYGMADIIDMMDANTLLVQAEQRISNAEYTLHQAVLKIVYTSGELLPYLLGTGPSVEHDPSPDMK